MAAESSFSIGELAEAAGVSRRAIRYYVQRDLLPPPAGLGRGRHYGPEHLERLREIQKLQAAGHALDSIQRILDGETITPQKKPESYPARRARGRSVELWTKIPLAEGAELQLNTAFYHLDVEQLLAIQRQITQILQSQSQHPEGDPTQDGEEPK